MKICTEADYLQAHLTVIVRAPRHWNPALHKLKQRITSILKKWIAAANYLPLAREDWASAFQAAPRKMMIAESCIQMSRPMTAASPPYTML
jgi:hypothetical protein